MIAIKRWFLQKSIVKNLLLFLCLSFATLTIAQIAPDKLVLDARKQVGVTVSYDPAYRKLAYPGGDLPIETGVCTVW
jgi:uncharacterized protein YijF (DUF1287 family)